MRLFLTEETVDEKKCLSCNNRTTEFYNVGENKEQAKNEFTNETTEEKYGKGFCSDCATDILTGNYEVFNEKNVNELVLAMDLEDDMEQALDNTNHEINDNNKRRLINGIADNLERYYKNTLDLEQLTELVISQWE